jgi:hypothetical protein
VGFGRGQRYFRRNNCGTGAGRRKKGPKFAVEALTESLELPLLGMQYLFYLNFLLQDTKQTISTIQG